MKFKSIIIALLFLLLTGAVSYRLFFHNEGSVHDTHITDEAKAETAYNRLPKADQKITTGKHDMPGMSVHDEMSKELKTEVNFNREELVVTNGESEDWKDCNFEINQTIVQKGYTYAQASIPAHTSIKIKLSDFSRAGVVFDPNSRKANNLLVMCSNANGQMGWSYSSNR